MSGFAMSAVDSAMKTAVSSVVDIASQCDPSSSALHKVEQQLGAPHTTLRSGELDLVGTSGRPRERLMNKVKKSNNNYQQQFFPTPSLLGRKASAEKGGGAEKEGLTDPTRPSGAQTCGPHERRFQ